MEQERKDFETSEYVKPIVEDYGQLKDLTAVVGGTFSDVPFGAPTGNGMSTP